MTAEAIPRSTDAHLDAPLPPDVRAELSPIERVHFETALRMNREPMKGFWSWCQETLGASCIRLLTGNLLRVEGLEHVADAHRRGAILLVANHRTYFDMFVVSSVLHRRLEGRKRLFFPVIGQFYYQSIAGLLLNQLFAFWSMFPPLFALPSHAASDRYSLALLAELCARGPGQILGIHPEGGRNLGPDPYSFMRIKPGAGKVIHAARPIVIPTFIAGLDNDVARQVRRNWTGGEPIRIWFGRPVPLDDYLALPGKGSTYKLITDVVMERVAELGALDRACYTADVRSEM